MVRYAVLITAAWLCTACGADAGDPAQTQAHALVSQGLRSEHEWIRAETVRLAGTYAAETWRESLNAALEDESTLVQTAALEARLRAGSQTVESRILEQLVSGSTEQRLQLVELVMRVGRPAFRQTVLGRALRDLSPQVRIAAMQNARRLNMSLGLAELDRLLSGENAEVSAEALQTLAFFNRNAAIDHVLTELRSGESSRRSRALIQARRVPSPSMWPIMRNWAATDPNGSAGRSAQIVLGHLGDAGAENALRTMVLGSDPDLAAEALLAISRIGTERATDQALVHRRDARPALRRAAFQALSNQERPADDFDLFLEDSDPELARDALLHVLRMDPERAAGRLARVLQNPSMHEATLNALYRASLHSDINGVIAQVEPLLRADLRSDDDAIAGLAARLLIGWQGLDALREELLASHSEFVLYAAIEAALAQPQGYEALFERGRASQIRIIQIAAAMGQLLLGGEPQ